MGRAEREAVGRLSQLTLLHRMKVYKIVSGCGLYMGQHPALEYIYRHDMCTQRELADYLSVSPASVAVSVKRLEKAGYITRRCDENDMRSNRLSVTEKGREVTEKCRQSFDEIDGEIFSDFSDEEMKALCSYLDRLIFNISGREFRHEDFRKLIAQEKEIIEKRKKEESL